MAGLLDVRRQGGIWGDPVPRVVGGAPSMMALPNNMNNPVAARRPAPPPSLMQRVGGGLGTLFGGANDPNLTPEQNRAAQQQALLQAGLNTILAAENGGSGLAAIAQGALAGQGAGQQAREIAYMSTQEERLRQALQNPAVIGKLTEEQKALIQLLPPMEAGKMLMELAFKPAAPAQVVAENSALVGPNGEVIFKNEGAPEGPDLPADLKAVLWASGVDANTLTPAQRNAALSRYEEMKRAGATTINMADPQQQFTNTNSLATQFRQDISDAEVVANGYAAVKVAAQNPSPAADMSLVFAFMKMMDPNSTVREGEQASAANAGSVPQRIWARYNRVLNGESFTPEQRADFLRQAELIARQRQARIAPTLKRYRDRAETGGVDPDDIVFDPFDGLLDTEEAKPAYSPDNPFIR